MSSEEKLEHMKEIFSQHWDELGELTFEQLAEKYVGDIDTFFTAAENLDAMSRDSDAYEGAELEAHIKRFMSVLGALIKVAYDHGKKMAIQ